MSCQSNRRQQPSTSHGAYPPRTGGHSFSSSVLCTVGFQKKDIFIRWPMPTVSFFRPSTHREIWHKRCKMPKWLPIVGNSHPSRKRVVRVRDPRPVNLPQPPNSRRAAAESVENGGSARRPRPSVSVVGGRRSVISLPWKIRRAGLTGLVMGGLVLGVTAYNLALHRFTSRGGSHACGMDAWLRRGFVAFCGRFVSVGNSCGEGLSGE